MTTTALGHNRAMPLPLLCTVLVALPWLWPFTSGPTAATQPYMASAAVAGLLLALWPARDADGGARLAARGWLAAALISSVIALLQYFDLEAPLFPWVNIASPGQAFGNLRQPNQLATLLVIGVLALYWLLRQRRLPVAAAAAMGALLLAALAATASRVGLAELLLLGVLLLWWSRAGGAGWRRPLIAAGAVLGLYLLAALALPALLNISEGVTGRDVLERLRTAESTCGSRLILWRNVLQLIALKPWFGWGWGELDYAHYITLYDGARFCHILDNAHNLPLHLAVELGLPLAMLACGLAAWALWRGQPWRERDATRQLAWGVLGAIAVHSMVEYPLWYGPFQIAAAISVWLLWLSRPAAASGATDTRRWARYGAAALLLSAVAYAHWDYQRVSQIFLPMDERESAWRENTLDHARQSRLFADVVRFAEVTTRPATRGNADWMLPNALQTLHYSPEPRVIIKVIESATLLDQDDLALAHLARFRAAFPREHRQWAQDNVEALQGAREQSAAAAAAHAGASRNAAQKAP